MKTVSILLFIPAFFSLSAFAFDCSVHHIVMKHILLFLPLVGCASISLAADPKNTASEVSARNTASENPVCGKVSQVGPASDGILTVSFLREGSKQPVAAQLSVKEDVSFVSMISIAFVNKSKVCVEADRTSRITSVSIL